MVSKPEKYHLRFKSGLKVYGYVSWKMRYKDVLNEIIYVDQDPLSGSWSKCNGSATLVCVVVVYEYTNSYVIVPHARLKLFCRARCVIILETHPLFHGTYPIIPHPGPGFWQVWGRQERNYFVFSPIFQLTREIYKIDEKEILFKILQ